MCMSSQSLPTRVRQLVMHVMLSYIHTLAGTNAVVSSTWIMSSHEVEIHWHLMHYGYVKLLTFNFQRDCLTLAGTNIHYEG